MMKFRKSMIIPDWNGRIYWWFKQFNGQAKRGDVLMINTTTQWIMDSPKGEVC